MGTIEENRNAWQHYDWPQAGDEWSARWGGTQSLWWGALFPRIRAFLPATTILEIGSGFGRFTQYLKDLCQVMVAVDISERCIEACRERFSDCDHIRYHVTDGQSLDVVPDGSVEFAFSFDSLVHAEEDVIEAYVGSLAKKLAPGGAAFLHHSNIGAFRDHDSRELRVENLHWRAETMSADRMVDACERAGLVSCSQEVVAWGGDVLNDCFSVLAPSNSPHCKPNVRFENPRFMEEADRLAEIARLYDFEAPEGGGGILSRLRRAWRGTTAGPEGAG